MKIFKDVRGSMDKVPTVEVNIDTVYVRSNIERVEEIDFSGWQYDEIQYDKNEYIEKLTNEEDSSMLAMMVTLLMSEVDMLKSIIMEGGE